MKEKPPEFFKSVKISLKKITKHPEINITKINDAVIKANKIVIHTLQFMKLFLIHHYDNNGFTIPKIDGEFINSTMKILCQEKPQGRPPKPEIKLLKDNLTKFYEEHYKPTTQQDTLDYTHINTVLDYLTEDIITMYENNIKFNYIDYIERYVNVVWKKKFLLEKITKISKTKADRETRKRNLSNDLRKIKNDLLNVENDELKSKPFYHEWITKQRKFILPNKDKYNQKSIYYDIKCSPMDYFPCMIFMMKNNENEDEKVHNVFPLRSEIIPKYIRLDTTTLLLHQN